MIVQRDRGIRSLLTLAQAAVVTALFWTGFAMMAEIISPGSAAFAGDYAICWGIILGGLGLEAASRGPDKFISPIYDSSLVRKFPIAFRQTCFCLAGVLLFIALGKRHAVSRKFLVGFSILLYGALLWTYAALPLWLVRRLFSRGREIPTLLVGPSERVAPLEQWLARKALLGLRIVGLISTDRLTAAPVSPRLPLLGGLDGLDQVVDSHKIAQVISLELPPPSLARQLFQKCEQQGLRLLTVNDFAEQIRHPIVCCVDEGVNLITLHEEPLENPFNRVVKRILDVSLSLLVLALVLPWLIPLAWLLQRWQSPGPLWHRQQRAGIQNRPFTILKFRTMSVSADASRPATGNDSRVFPAGRFLRHFSLDEMPQFLNVLRGEMSVVGPRPHLIEHNTQFAEALGNYHFRSLIKPGITGLAQVRGFRGEARTKDDISARLQSDLIYLENWSLGLDLSIVLRTVCQLFRPPRTAV